MRDMLASQRSESDGHYSRAWGGQLRLLRPAVRRKVVDLRRAKTPPFAVPAEDVELTTHRYGGVMLPSDAHVR